MYNELYRAASDSVNAFIAANPNKLALHPVDEGDSPISYNLAMTTSGMAILPRRSEGTMLRGDDGSDIGFVALNGTTLGGTMMVRSSAELQRYVRHGLISVSLPRSSIKRSGTRSENVLKCLTISLQRLVSLDRRRRIGRVYRKARHCSLIPSYVIDYKCD
jgi:hypothetical protein